MANRPKLWVYKTNANNEDYQTFSGDWTAAFRDSRQNQKPFKWVGVRQPRGPTGSVSFSKNYRLATHTLLANRQAICDWRDKRRQSQDGGCRELDLS